MKYKIISDSSCDLNKEYIKDGNISLSVSPLIINVDTEDFIDGPELNTQSMLDKMNSFKGKSTSSCPSPMSFFEEIKGADKYFIITISSRLSGSYNSANVAKEMYQFPNDVFIIDSKATSGILVLIVDKLIKLIKENWSYEDICTKINYYVNNNINLLFILNKFDNLVKNGRVSKIKAAIASTLTIKPICEANNGEIKFGKKVLGFKNAIRTLVNIIGERANNFSEKECVVTYCQNLNVAESLVKDIRNRYDFKEIKLLPMRGLNSFYALEGSIIVSFEG